MPPVVALLAGTGGNVPRIEARLEEPVERPRRRPREVERRRAGAAEVFKPRKGVVEHREVAGKESFVAEGKSGGDDRPRGFEFTMRGKALAVQGRPPTSGSRELQPQKRREDDADHRPAGIQQRDRDADAGKSTGEVRRAVEWIDRPHRGSARTPAFLGQDRDTRSFASEHL